MGRWEAPRIPTPDSQRQQAPARISAASRALSHERYVAVRS